MNETSETVIQNKSLFLQVVGIKFCVLAIIKGITSFRIREVEP